MDVVPRFASGQIIEIRGISLGGPMLTTVGGIAALRRSERIAFLGGAARRPTPRSPAAPPDPRARSAAPLGPTLFRTACYATRDTERQRRPDSLHGLSNRRVTKGSSSSSSSSSSSFPSAFSSFTLLAHLSFVREANARLTPLSSVDALELNQRAYADLGQGSFRSVVVHTQATRAAPRR